MDLIFFLLVLLLPHGAFSTTTDACYRRCGSTTVPYPFGFSAGCPIALSCEANTSTPIIPYGGDNSTSYRVLAFNSTASTILLALPPSCSRSIPDARRVLSGANYDVSSRTGLFLRGGCRETNTTVCSVPAPVMSGLLRTVQCGESNNVTSNAGAVACVSSTAANATSPRFFLRWDKAESTNCNDMLTSVVFSNTTEGTVSLEFSLAELGWWLNGTCTGGGDEHCAANATCSDVKTPTDTVGYRCACIAGMDGDGFLDGDGCSALAHWSSLNNRTLKQDWTIRFMFSKQRNLEKMLGLEYPMQIVYLRRGQEAQTKCI